MTHAKAGKRVLVAGPTTGKSKVKEELSAYFDVIDTDDVTRELWPEWFENRLFETPDPDQRARLTDMRDEMVGEAVGRLLAQDPSVFILSNIWGPKFWASIARTGPDVEPDAYYFRSDPDEISRLMTKRGGSVVPLETLERWVASAREHAPKVFKRVIEVPNGRFLSDYVRIVRN